MKNLKLSLSLAFAAILLGVAGYLIAASSFLPTPAASEQPVGYIGQLAITDYNVSKGNSIAFRGFYDRQYWSGDVFAYQVDKNGAITANELWEGAAFHLQVQNPDTGRMIATMKTDGTAIPFRWSSLSAAQQTSLNATAATSQNILDFVRGDRSGEVSSGGTFRDRSPSSVLGDIIHSRPAYVENGANPVLFVGANDGMLHAFDARGGSGGAELWAYVPSMVIGNLKNLTVDPYVHTYFVDGGLNVGEVSIGGASKKVLVSALGAGGKGLFALDVTTPTATSEDDAASKRLWEITPTSINGAASASYANLGYTYGVPLIVQLNTTGHPWAVIVGNGYNNTGNGHSVLYVINIADGTLIRAIDTGSGTAGTSPGGLSSPAAIDTNADGYVDRVYAGDIDGKLWKFDISNSDSAIWSSSLLYTTSPAMAITMAPAVATHISGGFMVNFGTGRSFTSGAGSSYDIDTTTPTPSLQQNYVYGIWDGAPVANAVMLTQTLTERQYDNGSTGAAVSTITITDPAGAASSVTGVLFDGVSILSSAQNFPAGSTAGTIAVTLSAALTDPVGFTHTVSGNVITFTATASGGAGKQILVTSPTAAALMTSTAATPITTLVRTVTNNAPNWTSGAANHKGWKVALPPGERLLGDTVFIENGRFYFNATNPTKLYPAASGTPNGDNWLMELNYMTGGSADTPFLDLNGDLLLNNGDRVTYIDTDTIPTGKVVGNVVVNGSGAIDATSLPVGKLVTHGVSSHPLLVQLATLNTTLLNENPDVTIPSPAVQLGIIGGHFDEEVYFRDNRANICSGTTSGGSAATATLTVGSTGSAIPSTLGAIDVDGTPIMVALTTSDITNGTDTSTNASTIRTKINAKTSTSGFSATVSGNVVTVRAPVGASYNGSTFNVVAGTSLTPVAAMSAVSTLVIGDPGGQATRITGVTLGGTSVLGSTQNFAAGSTAISIATALSGVLTDPVGWTHGVSGATITYTQTATGGAAKTIVVTSTAAAAVAPVAGVPAVSKLRINAQPAGQNSVIQNVTLGGTDILAPARVDFPSGTSISGIASTLSTALTTPGAFTKSITTTNAANDTITYTETANFGAAKTFAVTSNPIAEVIGVAPVAAVPSTALITFAGGTTRSNNTPRINDDIGSTSQSVRLGSMNLEPNDIDPGNSKTPAQVATTVKNQIGTVGTVTAYIARNAITPQCNDVALTSATVCLVDTNGVNGNAVVLGSLSNFNTVTYSTTNSSGGTVAVAEVIAVTPYSVQSTTVSAVNGTPAVPGSPAYAVQPTSVTATAGTSAVVGWTDLSAAITSSGVFAGGVDGTFSTTSCGYDSHTHQYDKLYDRTGVNMLNASVAKLNLGNAIPNAATQFKVVVANQYLSPAVKINLNNPTYTWNIDSGYVKLKDYATSASLTSAAFSALPTYTPATVGSLVINMPVDAFSPKNWWGDGTPGRAGLHPVKPQCVWNSESSHDGNMYRPINPPANGTNGPGTKGWSASSGTGATATGVRHGGALVIQVIKATTPFSAMEESIPGHPEYGWRVKSASFENYVLVEWATFWHHPTNGCYSDATWVNNPAQDDSTSNPVAGAAGATDPKVGSFGASQGSVSEVVLTTVTVNSSGVTTTTVMTMTPGGAGGAPNITTTTTTTPGSGPATPSNTSTKRVTYLNGAWTEIVTTTNSNNTLTIVETSSNGDVTTTIVPNNAGQIVTGGDEKGSQSRTGRISWSEMFR
ncbi:MAG: PilC/PilY family type IV pilus protein [Sulfuritalea sp.]|nr:PilC/PilY family type IV pilus protein [Sulfuritalea sp.]MDP1985048.1 PilC/PilY family type IV pilus protein [Sulfuritalea sp.]